MGTPVHHPDHYNWLPGIECMDVVEHFDFCLGNAIKYIWRAGKKDSEGYKTDLKKAIEYLTVALRDYEVIHAKNTSGDTSQD